MKANRRRKRKLIEEAGEVLVKSVEHLSKALVHGVNVHLTFGGISGQSILSLQKDICDIAIKACEPQLSNQYRETIMSSARDALRVMKTEIETCIGRKLE